MVVSENNSRGTTFEKLYTGKNGNSVNGFSESNQKILIHKNKNGALTGLGLMFFIFVIYFIAGKLGLELAYENASATAVWAPTGISLAFFLLRGYKIFPANINKVQEPFFTTKDTGTGLGSTLAYEVIKANMGKINFQSKINEGTEIVVMLPVCKDC
jgi:hypothetical protein